MNDRPGPRLSVKSRQTFIHFVCLIIRRTFVFAIMLKRNDFIKTFLLPTHKMYLKLYLCVIMTIASLTNDDIGLLTPALAFIIIS